MVRFAYIEEKQIEEKETVQSRERDDMRHLGTKLAALATTACLTAVAGDAQAGSTNFSRVADNIVDSAATLPNLISTVAYIGGIGMGVAGIFKLKQHVDNPGQAPMKDGLIRLGAGGGLLALPFMTEAMAGSVADSSSQGVNPSQLKFQPVNF